MKKAAIWIGALGIVLAGYWAPATAVVPVSRTTFSEVLVDGEIGTSAINIGPGDIAGALDNLAGITVTLDFIKCGDIAGPSVPGTCGAGTGDAWANEISFKLQNPVGTQVTLVGPNDYYGEFDSGPGQGARVTVTFDDLAGSLVGSNGLAGGTFLPTQTFASLLGGPVVGNWTLYVEDTAGGAPLGLASFRLDMVVVSSVPEPSMPAMMGLGLCLMLVCRRRRARAA